MKKSFVALLLIFSVVFILTGCTSERENKTDSSSFKSSSFTSSSPKTASSSAVTPTVKLGDVTASVGDTVKIPVTVTANAGIAATDMIIYFDTKKFKYVSTNIGTGYNGGIINGKEVENGKVGISLITLNVPNDACEMYTVSFEVLKGTEGVNDFKLEVASCNASDAVTDITTNAVNGSVTVK